MVPRANVVARTAFAQARTTSTTAQALTSSSAQSGLAFGALTSGLLAGAIGGAFFGIIGGIVGSLVFGLFGGILGMSAASICCAAKDLNGSIIRVKKVRVRSHYTLILHALPSPSHIDTHVHTPSPRAESSSPAVVGGDDEQDKCAEGRLQEAGLIRGRRSCWAARGQNLPRGDLH